MKKTRKILSLMLTVAMVFSLLGVNAFAAEQDIPAVEETDFTVPVTEEAEEILPETVDIVTDEDLLEEYYYLQKAYAADDVYFVADGVTYYQDVTSNSYAPSGYDGGVAVGGYNGTQTDLTIPESVEYEGKTYAVTMIGDSGLSYGQGCIDNDLKVVSLPDSIREIEMLAFQGTGITQIDLPERLERIGDYAFSGTALMEVRIPENVEYIGTQAFFNCMYLKNVYIYRPGREYISYGNQCFGYYYDSEDVL